MDDEKDSRELLRDKQIVEEYFFKILTEIKYLEHIQTPPVNYLAVIIVSMLSSALVAWLFTH